MYEVYYWNWCFWALWASFVADRQSMWWGIGRETLHLWVLSQLLLWQQVSLGKIKTSWLTSLGDYFLLIWYLLSDKKSVRVFWLFELSSMPPLSNCSHCQHSVGIQALFWYSNCHLLSYGVRENVYKALVEIYWGNQLLHTSTLCACVPDPLLL